MSFTNRDKPKLFERIRGKSGRDLVNEVKSAFNRDNGRMFFDTPSWSNSHSSFPRGFPFNEEEPLSSGRYFPRDRGFGNRVFQDFHEPPWDEDRENKRRVPNPEETVEPSQSRPPRPSLNQHGLRNTVPLAKPAEVERPVRAMSAPPCDRPQRFTSTCEIPIMGDSMSSQSAPAPAPQQPPTASNNVRVIPIQVEGRDEPLINSNIDTSTNFGDTPSTFDGRLPRDFGPFRKHSARFQQSPPQQQQQPQQSPPQQQQQQQQKPKQQQPKSKQQGPQQETASPQKGVDEPDRAPVPPPDPTAIALSRIADVHNQVDQLAKQVNSCSVSSRNDKEYVYLDEMLTRQLLSLDNVDPAGQDNIRQARRDAIKSIQKCISVLESKVPTDSMNVEASTEPTESTVTTDEEPTENEKPKTFEEQNALEPMVVNESSDNIAVNSESKSVPEDPPA